MKVVLQALSYAVGGSNLKDFISGLRMGLSIAEMFVGVMLLEGHWQEDGKQRQ